MKDDCGMRQSTEAAGVDGKRVQVREHLLIKWYKMQEAALKAQGLSENAANGWKIPPHAYKTFVVEILG